MADVSKLLHQADDAARRKSYDLAVELYQQILVLDSDSERARLSLRETELKKLEDFGLPSRPGVAIANLFNHLKVAFYRRAKKLDLCVIEYEKMLARDPRSKTVAFPLGQTLEATSQIRSAFAVYKGILLVDPADFNANMAAGRTARDLGRLDDALVFFDAARRINPRDKTATDAHRDVSATMSLKPREDAGSFRDLVKSGAAAQQKKADEKAVSPSAPSGQNLPNLKARFESAPGDAGAALAYSRELAASGKHGEALSVVKRALEAGPRSKDDEIQLLDAELGFFDATARPGKPGSALEADKAQITALKIRLLRARLLREPTRSDYRFDLGVLLFDAGELDEAISSFQQAKKEPKKSRDASFWLGRAFLEKGKANLAVNQLEGALETGGSGLLDARAKETIYFLGKAKAASGDKAGARKEFERIYEEDINYRDVAKLLEEGL